MIIKRYLSREVVNVLLAVTAIILLAFISQQIVRYLNYVAIGKIPANVMLQLISFEIPYLLAILLPLCLYLSVLLVYSRLYTDNEMAILQLSGFGMRQLTFFTFKLAALVASVVLVLMLFINPWISEKRQYLMATGEATLHLLKTLLPGRFQASPDGNTVIYVESLSRDHERAKNIFLAQQKPGALPGNWTVVVAEEGFQASNEKHNQFFNALNGFRYEGQAGHNDFTITQFSRYAIMIPETEISISHDESESLNTEELWQNYNNPKHAAEFQWRFSIAISTFILALFAVPMCAVRPRQGRFLILIPAIVIYIIYINLLFMARHWIETGVMPIALGMWWLHVLMLSILIIFIKISSRWR